MPVPTPFHPRTSALCTSLSWKEWAGCHAVRRFDPSHEREYYAIRHAAALLDVTPLYKVDVKGPNAAELLSRVMVRGYGAQKVGSVSYVCWCDERGNVLDDGTVTRLDDLHWRVTSADPNAAWLFRHARGLDVAIEDMSRALAALALQGPTSRAVLRELVGSAIDDLRFFKAMRANAAGREIVITRTGYTGDLGYELWVENDGALALWDAVVEAGEPFGLTPMGLDALDVSRVEAGFVLSGVDYFSARTVMIESQTTTPYEIGLGWTVKLEREAFVGQPALRAASVRGPRRELVGVEIDWAAYEALYEEYRLPPELHAETCRLGAPLYSNGRQIGQVTSRAWSPTLKAYIGLASVTAEYAALDTPLEAEVTIEYERRRCPARVVKKPFFDPERKKA